MPQFNRNKMPRPTEQAILEFGVYDYARLLEINPEDIEEINEITDRELKKIADLLKKLIKQRRLYIMDKESGVAFDASTVIGFQGDKILIANER